MANLSNDELEKRVSQLETENAVLRATRGSPRVPEPPTAETPHKRGWGWTLLSVVLVLVGLVLAPVAVVSSWAKTELTDAESFVATFAPLAEDPDVQAFVTDQAVDVITTNVDIPATTSNVIDGIISLGTGPLATDALNSLKGPAAAGLQSLITNLVSRFVASDAFADVWAQTLRVSHTQMVKTLTNSDDATIVVGADGTIGIQLGPIIDRIKTELVNRGLTLAENIPSVNRTIQIADADALLVAQAVYPLVTAVGLWLPWIALAFLAAGVLVARRRAVALVWTSVALAVSMLILMAGYGIARVFFVNAVAQVVPASTAGVIYDQVVVAMRDTTLAVVILGIVIAVVAWLAGPFRAARNLRRLTKSGFAGIRRSAERHGVSTGRFGSWLYAQRVLLRVVITAIGAAVVVFTRPLSAAVIIWTLVLAVLAIALVELLQRPPGEPESDSGSTGSGSTGSTTPDTARA